MEKNEKKDEQILMKFADIIIDRHIPCKMRDGVTLYGDIYRPSIGDVFPILLMRTLYGRAIASTVTSAHPIWYVRHGYVVIVQDVRGRGDSEGEIVPFTQEVLDGYDTIEWAAALPYSTGRVGMYGFSYQGVVQWAAAAAHPPHLVTIAPGMCTADLYTRFYPHGRFAWETQLWWALQFARDSAKRVGDTASEETCMHLMREPSSLLWQMPQAKEHPVLKKYCPFFYEWMSHPTRDSFWEQENWIPSIMKQPIPTLQIGGWYDHFLNGTLQTYEALEAESEQSSPKLSQTKKQLLHRLVIGPWTHIPWGRFAGGLDHGTEADGHIHQLQLKWFDYWLKDQEDVEFTSHPNIQYFELGSQTWQSTDQLINMTRNNKEIEQRWYLSASGKPANGALGGGLLIQEASDIKSEGAEVFVYDARLPMSISGYLASPRHVIQDRYEILIYTSSALTEPIHLFGQPKLKVMYQVLNGPTDLVAILSIVSHSGARFISIGRAEIASDHHTEGQWKSIEIDLRHVGVQIKVGEMLRLELTGSAFPLFSRHPNGASENIHTIGTEGLNIATVAISSKAKSSSWLELPIKRAE